MSLTDEQIVELKSQLKQQVQHLPADKKAAAEEQIESLSPEALEDMLNEQKSRATNPSENKSIFRRIVDGDIPSVKVAENSVSAAYMNINPVSKGHIIILPKKAVDDAKKLPTGAFTLAKKLASKAESKLKANSTEIQTENKFDEAYVNIIPVYDKPVNINSPRSIAKIEELEEIAKLIRPNKRATTKKKQPAPVQVLKKESIHLSRRIP
jgi:histidine triad (HIT) family protein